MSKMFRLRVSCMKEPSAVKTLYSRVPSRIKMAHTKIAD